MKAPRDKRKRDASLLRGEKNFKASTEVRGILHLRHLVSIEIGFK